MTDSSFSGWSVIPMRTHGVWSISDGWACWLSVEGANGCRTVTAWRLPIEDAGIIKCGCSSFVVRDITQVIEHCNRSETASSWGARFRNGAAVDHRWCSFTCELLESSSPTQIYVHAAGLGTNNTPSGTSCICIHRSILEEGTSILFTQKRYSVLSPSSSFLRCLFLTIAIISLGLIFLSNLHLLMRDLYCRSLIIW
jgi:hypothetical protein